MPAISIGRVVQYRLHQADVDQINRRREDWRRKTLRDRGDSNDGYQAHVGNDVTEGDYLPAIIVRTIGKDTANLQVLLDGNDTLWATSRSQGDEPGTWTWPPRS